MPRNTGLTTRKIDTAPARAPASWHALEKFLMESGVGRSIQSIKPKQTIFLQGSPATAIYFIQSGKVRMTVISKHGREGVIAMLEPGSFFGECCLLDVSANTASATTMTKSTVIRIEKKAMLRLLDEEPYLAGFFMTFLLSRNQQIEADLLDHLFNSSEQRLARLLLMLARNSDDTGSEMVIPKISQEILAARVGTTRSRINFFMNKFRKAGLIEYDNHVSSTKSGVKVRPSLINVILQE